MSDTIAAIATAPGPSAIGILRLSGPEALSAASAVFRSASGRLLESYQDRVLVFGELLGPDGRPIDQVLATVSRSLHSYTGEDTAELHCHGSPAVLALGLEALFAQGVRQAGPGEFTRRAFLNGRLDLTQAEAVADLIDAETPAAVYQAAGQLTGALSRRVMEIYDVLVDVLAHFHAVLDYPDEDVDPFREELIAAALEQSRAELSALLATYERGRYLSKGAPCVLVGRPNVGKSSLLNALAGYERAIVTEIPGTTRDTVEARCNLGGVDLRLVDTAGVRKSADPVEQAGVARSRAAMEHAALILAVLDQSRPASAGDLALIGEASSLAPVIVVLNKCDLPPVMKLSGALEHLPQVRVSAATGEGIVQLGEQVAELFPALPDWAAGETITNVRHFEAAQRALKGVERASEALVRRVTPDALLTDVEEALAALGELTGTSLREDITARIFERFCVGK